MSRGIVLKLSHLGFPILHVLTICNNSSLECHSHINVFCSSYDSVVRVRVSVDIGLCMSAWNWLKCGLIGLCVDGGGGRV
jgi:hypothetical protein